jgi:hypothetical protein
MDELNAIYAAIAAAGFSAETLQMIDNLTNDIRYGRKDFNGFTLPEHAGLCKGGAPLIGASIVAGYARRSLTTGGHAESSEGSKPANWQIDEAQERFIEEWARAKGLWFEHSESIIEKNFGPMIAEGAEAKVYYKAGDPSVAKERTPSTQPPIRPWKLSLCTIISFQRLQ